MQKNVEVTSEIKLAFKEDGLLPVIVQEFKTKDVLMLAYMNSEALKKSLELGEMVYYSRSRKKLWHKGETSGNVQKIVELRVDCDQDTILAVVEQIGSGACHTGKKSCFYRVINNNKLRFDL